MFRFELKKPCLMSGEVSLSHNRKTCRGCKAVYARNYRKTETGKLKESIRWKKMAKTPMSIAKTEVYKAIRVGILEKASLFKCTDCENKASVYDHRDYAKPLHVDPVCRRCNLKRGKGLNHERH